MPLTSSGQKTLRSMLKQYGPKKGKRVFYASMNKGTLSRRKMEKRRKSGHQGMGM